MAWDPTSVEIGDSTKKSDYDRVMDNVISLRDVKVVTNDDFTITDDDGFAVILVTTGASDRTITLPTLADNPDRPLTFIKADSGAGKVIIDGEGAEAINGETTATLVSQYDRLSIIGAGSEWLISGLKASYNTGWINRSDWTNVHLGSDDTKNADSNVTHNLNRPLSDLVIRVLISTDGADANSFEIFNTQHDNDPAVVENVYGIAIYQVNSNNVKVQTGARGAAFYTQDDGTGRTLNTEDWYYKIKVSYSG